MLNNQLFRATAVAIGTVIGAGIFGLPYAFAKSGFLIGVIYLIILTIAFLITNLCYTEVVLRTKDKLEMSGYARRYLGRNGKIIITLSLVLGIFAALVAYTIGVGNFLDALISPLLKNSQLFQHIISIFGSSRVFWSVIFWAIASFIVSQGIGIVSRLEFFMSFILILVVLYIFGISYPYINLNNLLTVNLKNVLFPYGVVLFALGGASSIPTMRRLLTGKAYLLKRAVVLGSTIPALIYFIFAFTVVGVSGSATTEQAVIGLHKFSDGSILLIGGIFGILAMTTSFLTLAYILRELLQRDYKIKKFFAWSLTVFIPLIFFLLGIKSFVRVISFSGGVLSGIQGIVLILAYYYAKKLGDRKPEFSFNLPKPIAYFICLMFIVGIIYQFIYI